MRRAVIVGAGLSGMTAGVLLSEAGWRVSIFETRDHIGGNCYDEVDSDVFVHTYGPHIFHTNSVSVHNFVNRFSDFYPYSHVVKAKTSQYGDKLLSIPYSKVTEDEIGRSLSDDEIKELFFHEYSEKMWGMPWEELPEHITTRVPTRRDNLDERYFTDTYQAMPVLGYTHMFDNMFDCIYDNKGELFINGEDDDWKKGLPADLLIYTGSIDEFYGGKLGWLPYRTLDIKRAYLHPEDRLPVAVVNECNKKPFTRTTDYSRLIPWAVDNVIDSFIPATVEYPRIWERGDIRYYPMKWNGGEDLYKQYASLDPAMQCDVVFAGRLGAYSYLNMDQAIERI